MIGSIHLGKEGAAKSKRVVLRQGCCIGRQLLHPVEAVGTSTWKTVLTIDWLSLDSFKLAAFDHHRKSLTPPTGLEELCEGRMS